MKSDFEAMGGTYTQEGDYLLPYVEIPEAPQIGVWGQRRRKFLREQKKPLYTAMQLGGTLDMHLEETDKSAVEMFDRLVSQLVAGEGITDELKAKDQLAWVGQMNDIRSRAAEIVNKELIFV